MTNHPEISSSLFLGKHSRCSHFRALHSTGGLMGKIWVTEHQVQRISSFMNFSLLIHSKTIA